MRLVAPSAHAVDGAIAIGALGDRVRDGDRRQARLIAERMAGAEWENREVSRLDAQRLAALEREIGLAALDDVEMRDRPREAEAPGRRIFIGADELAAHPHQ